jgi:uncharacterized protein YbbC (DUF1343 family)
LLLFGSVSNGAGAAEAPARSSIVPASFAAIGEVVEREIAAERIPGAVIVVGSHDHVLYRQAFGWRSLVPTREKMTVDTVFDLASLTKIVATTTAIMQLIDQNRLALDAKVSRYWPAFAANGKEDVTIEELLTHTSGLRPDLDLSSSWKGRPAAALRIEHEKLAAPPGTRFIYSDINFEALGEIVQRVSGQSLDNYATRHIFAPLHMTDTGFRVSASLRERTAPTDYQDGVLRRGTVQDPTAFRMGGVAGDAGLFSTADDLARFAAMILDSGRLDRAHVLSGTAVARMTAVYDLPGSVHRGLGWDIASPYSAGFDKAFGIDSFGHTGYTGTSLWIDPATDRYLIILTSRLHPRDRGDVKVLRTEIGHIVAAAIKPMKVVTGIDRLETEGFAPLQGRRIGLIANDSARDGEGRRVIDVLAKAPGVDMVALFTPEHGRAAMAEGAVADDVDPSTGLPIHSLYGTDRRPSDSVLKGLGALVIDLPDVGVRFFTYATTMAYVMEAAARLDIPVYVLDRPNPINAAIVEGPVLEPERRSFTGYFPLPLRHGMTLGELARLFNGEAQIGAKLTVVPMTGYRRESWFDETGLAWFSPSPNLPSLQAATFYPGIGLIEAANVSVGRGTPQPFALIGAPWIDGNRLARELRRRTIPGVEFEPTRFTPSKDRYAGRLCQGVHLLLTDRRSLDAARLGLELIAALRRLYPDEFDLARTHGLVGSSAVFDALAHGADPRAALALDQPARAKFEQRRALYLLYR